MAKKSWRTVSKDSKRVVIESDDGKTKTLLTPTGKCAKFKAELIQYKDKKLCLQFY